MCATASRHPMPRWAPTARRASSSPPVPSIRPASTSPPGAATSSRASSPSRRPASTPGDGALASGADAYVLTMPSSDTGSAPVHGQKMHDVLRLVHEQGSCRDAAHVDDVLAGHGFDDDDRVRGRARAPRAALSRPARRRSGTRSPGRGSTASRSRRSWRRLDSTRSGVTTASSPRTTTRPASGGPTASPTTRRRGCRHGCSRPLADALGLRIRVVFEHLAAEVVDDPEPFEPDADDLADDRRRAAAPGGVDPGRDRVRRRGRRRGVRDAAATGRSAPTPRPSACRSGPSSRPIPTTRDVPV